MLAVARKRIADRGWTNVELVDALSAEAKLPDADAALFFFTHDLVRTPTALDNVATAVRPGGRIVAAGMQLPSQSLVPLALATRLVMRRYITTDDGMRKPWDLLGDRLDDVTVETVLLGAIYVVGGRRPAENAASTDGGA